MKQVLHGIFIIGLLLIGQAFARDMIVPYQPRFSPDHQKWQNPGPAKTPGEWMHPSQRDNDNDGIPNYKDTDDDNDGIPDNVDKKQYQK